MATAALSAAVLFTLVVEGYTVMNEGWGGPNTVFVFVGPRATPFIVPAAFLAGAVVWRTLPEIPYYGPITGILATALTYLVAAGFLSLLFALYFIVEAFKGINPSPVIPDALILVMLYGFVGFIYTFWLTLPLSAVSGYIHEQARENVTEQ